MKNVAVFFLQKRLGGGTTTYTAHLIKALEAAGANPTLYKVHMKSEPVTGAQDFGEYGIKIIEVSAATAVQIALNTPSIIAAPTSPENLPKNTLQRLRKAGAWGVIHDATQFKLWSKYINAPSLAKLERMVCIRESMLRFMPAVFIRHPYQRQCLVTSVYDWANRKEWAVSTARVHNQKRTALILQANQILPKRRRIRVCGAEYRLYSYGLAKRYGDVFQQQGGELQFPLDFKSAVHTLGHAQFNVDMSKFSHDGGGTQYCQLEAMDAGCVNVMHEDWFNVEGTLNPASVITVQSSEDLAFKLGKPCDSLIEIEKIRALGFLMLSNHDPKLVGKKYLKTLGA